MEPTGPWGTAPRHVTRGHRDGSVLKRRTGWWCPRDGLVVTPDWLVVTPDRLLVPPDRLVGTPGQVTAEA
ncbi:hypothetical protein ABZV92_11360 [Streptomyces rubiginosohelvolus]|uniref:hypothetical protein n=1 Tax=Streptomyces rubiginosohelvolus TaxID=67362 RepID=UPI0033B84714